MTKNRRIRELKELELKRNKMLASKRARQVENHERKGDAEVAMQMFDVRRSTLVRKGCAAVPWARAQPQMSNVQLAGS